MTFGWLSGRSSSTPRLDILPSFTAMARRL